MSTVFINGKFTAQRLTGVQRYAGQMVQALDDAVQPGERWVLLVPAQGVAPRLQHIEVRRVGRWRGPLHAWEQLLLPWAARSGLLINLSGSAPLLARRQWCTFHDAAVFDHPQAFTARFGAWYRFHFRHLARHARLLTVSAHSRRRLAARLDLPEDAIDVVCNGGDHFGAVREAPEVRARLRLAGCRWVLAVGSANPLKNLPALLRAWEGLVVTPDLRLVLVGGSNAAVFADGPGAALPAQTVRADNVDDGELKSLLLGAQALVMPSIDEGFGLPALEAMALGCPVLAARAGALPEVCGDAAMYFDPRQPVSLTHALRRVLGDEQLRGRMSVAGRARAGVFTWARSAGTLRAMLLKSGELA